MLSIEVQGIRLDFEHSLLSLSKWEADHEKPFFAWTDKEKRTREEMIDYFRCMVVSPDDGPEIVEWMTDADHVRLIEYINAPRTATIVREPPTPPGPKENVTSELIYYWLVALKIPFHPTETWHLNRLMMLVKVCGVKQGKPEKVSASQAAARYRELNEQRKRELGTRG